MKADLTQLDRLTMLMMTEKSDVIVKRTDREPTFTRWKSISLPNAALLLA